MKQDIFFASESYKIQGAIFEVYKEIGCGFLEAVYQECLEREFILREIPYKSQQQMQMYYKHESHEKANKIRD